MFSPVKHGALRGKLQRMNSHHERDSTMIERDDLERRLDLAAELALRTRERVEAAIDSGEVPSWILDACNVLERASLQYGELSVRLGQPGDAAEAAPRDAEMPAITLESLTVH